MPTLTTDLCKAKPETLYTTTIEAGGIDAKECPECAAAQHLGGNCGHNAEQIRQPALKIPIGSTPTDWRMTLERMERIERDAMQAEQRAKRLAEMTRIENGLCGGFSWDFNDDESGYRTLTSEGSN